jgi:hypothetical protein
MDALWAQCDLVTTAEVAADAVLQAAETELVLVVPYCQYLLEKLDSALTKVELNGARLLVAGFPGALPECYKHPMRNIYTVFVDTWHSDSLATLSDADVANLWRLAEYMMLGDVCIQLLTDVVVQRHVRASVPNRLIQSIYARDNIDKRVSEILCKLPRRDYCRAIARHGCNSNNQYFDGLSADESDGMPKAAIMWGHLNAPGLSLQRWLLPSTTSSVLPTSVMLFNWLFNAASTNQVQVLKLLHQYSGYYNKAVFEYCIRFHSYDSAIWWLEQSSEADFAGTRWQHYIFAAEWSNLPVIQHMATKTALLGSEICELLRNCPKPESVPRCMYVADISVEKRAYMAGYVTTWLTSLLHYY